MLVFRYLMAVSVGVIIALGYGGVATSQGSGGEEAAQRKSTFSLSEPEPTPLMSPFSQAITNTGNYTNPFLLIQSISSPENLDPSANPLLFPTEPDEVEIETIELITLEQAIELARRNNRDFREAKLNLESSRESLREALASEYPTIATQADFTRSDSANTELSQISSPLFSQFTGNTAGDTVTTSLDWRLEINYDLFTSGRRSAQIEAAEEQVRFNHLESERISEQIRFDATAAYYNLQEADAQVRINLAAVEQAETSLEDTVKREIAGLGTKFDVLRDQVQLSNAQQDLKLARSQQLIARRALVQILGLGQKIEVRSADPIRKVGEWDLSLEDSIVLALRNRAELEQQLVQRNISERQRRIALSNIGPQATLFATYNVLGVLDDEFSPTDGLLLGARVRWLLFDGGASRARAEQEQKNIEIAKNRFDNQRNQIRLEVEQAFYNLKANEENIPTAAKAVKLAEENLRLARLRLRAGVGTKLDEINAQSELTRAQNNLVRAVIEYNRALSSMHRAVSNLPDGRLFDLP